MNFAILAIDVALKSVLFLTLTFLTMPFLRRASAAVRHFVWLAALIALAALPFLSAKLPAWRILPAWRAANFENDTVPPLPSSMFAELAGARGVSRVEFSVSKVADAFDQRAPRSSFNNILLRIWLYGACLALAPLFLGWLSLRRLEARAFINTNESCLDLLNTSMLRLGTSQPIILLESPHRAMPMTWGIFRPRVLLPMEARAWPGKRREFALLHELAHIKRGDNAVNYFAYLICALYWFNPLIWLAAAKLRLECEKACDDLVVSSSREAEDYADELLELSCAPGIQAFSPLAASPMARKSTLEKRLLAILDNNQNRTQMKQSQFTAVIALAAAVVIPVSILSTSSAEAQNDSAAPSVSTTSGNDENILKTFEVSEGGTLKMMVDQGNIEVTGAEGTKIGVSIHRRVKNADDADVAAFLSQHPIEFEHKGSDLTIIAKNPENQSHSWTSHRPNLEVEYKITVPQKYNLNLTSGGGNIEAGRVNGAAQLRTGGGDIDAYEIQTLMAESGGGNLEVKSIHGDVTARTGGGSARVTDCAGSANVKSGGGNITVDNITGASVEADTGGGSVSSDLASVPANKCEFKSGGGNIQLKINPDSAFTIDAATGGGSVTSELSVSRTDNPKSTDTLKGAVNGGGPALKIRTGGGDIHISKR